MALNLANVQTTDTFSTWLTRTNQIIDRASNTTPDALTFIGNTAVVPHSEGKLFYDSSVDSLRYFASANTSIAIGHEVNIYVKNNTGSVIPKGSAVYSDGEDNAVPTVQLSRADAESTHDVLGLTKEEINAGDTGHITVTGIVFTDTSSFSVGNLLYVSPTTAGALTATEPTFPNFPVRVGKVLLSSATQGCILVSIVDETFGEIRATEDARVDGSLTVAGNFNVLGSETITSVTNLEVDDSFVYLNGGDTLVANTTLVTGLNDFTFKGHYNGGNTVTYYVKIDNTNPGNPDTFSWSLDNFSSTEAANVAITGAEQLLRWGISAQFVANTGHTAGDIWTAPAALVNIDTGWASNRNVGQAAGGYTHLGVFFDVTDERFKFFQSYRPSVSGNINTSHDSFQYGSITANNITVSSATVNGTLTAQEVNATSDMRLKMNINPIEGALDKVMRLAGVEFDWVDSSKRSIGVVAQQVEEVLPELVHTDKDGYKSVSYGNLTALLIEAVKELSQTINKISNNQPDK